MASIVLSQIDDKITSQVVGASDVIAGVAKMEECDGHSAREPAKNPKSPRILCRCRVCPSGQSNDLRKIKFSLTRDVT